MLQQQESELRKLNHDNQENKKERHCLRIEGILFKKNNTNKDVLNSL